MNDADPVAHWEARYAERDKIWSGNPNAALVASVSHLTPGHALDLGCGEGADSVWLAAGGWRVTGVDIASNAIARAKTHAAERGIPDDRITWVTADLGAWQPDAEYDLVSACFLHSTITFPRHEIIRRAAGAIARGGHLLIVGHAAAPPWSRLHDHAEHRFLTPAEEIDELGLDMAQWNVLVSDVEHRSATGPDGEAAELDDSVVLVQRVG